MAFWRPSDRSIHRSREPRASGRHQCRPWAPGLIVALAEFIPCIGPILAAIPALLVAVTHGESAVLLTFAAFLLIPQVEGNLVAPLIQRRNDFYSASVGAARDRRHRRIGGRHGLVLATPIVVVIFVFMQKAYVRDALKESVNLPGEPWLDLGPTKCFVVWRSRSASFRRGEKPATFA
jgi:hypothetical protein